MLKEVVLRNQEQSHLPIETVYVFDSADIEYRSPLSSETWILFLHFPYSKGIEDNLHSSFYFSIYCENNNHNITLQWYKSEHREYISQLDDDQPAYLIDIVDHHKNLLFL